MWPSWPRGSCRSATGKSSKTGRRPPNRPVADVMSATEMGGRSARITALQLYHGQQTKSAQALSALGCWVRVEIQGKVAVHDVHRHLQVATLPPQVHRHGGARVEVHLVHVLPAVVHPQPIQADHDVTGLEPRQRRVRSWIGQPDAVRGYGR